MAFCNNFTIKNSKFINRGEPWILRSNNNLFTNNTCSNNFHGICIDDRSKNNILEHNNFTNNELCGVILEYYSNNNLIIKNNFINNKINGYPQSSFANKWKSNYWDNWIGTKMKLLRFTPKIILGSITVIKQIRIVPNFDFNPSEKPY